MKLPATLSCYGIDNEVIPGTTIEFEIDAEATRFYVPAEYVIVYGTAYLSLEVEGRVPELLPVAADRGDGPS